jgi:hypothetical protein
LTLTSHSRHFGALPHAERRVCCCSSSARPAYHLTDCSMLLHVSKHPADLSLLAHRLLTCPLSTNRLERGISSGHRLTSVQKKLRLTAVAVWMSREISHVIKPTHHQHANNNVLVCELVSSTRRCSTMLCCSLGACGAVQASGHDQDTHDRFVSRVSVCLHGIVAGNHLWLIWQGCRQSC